MANLRTVCYSMFLLMLVSAPICFLLTGAADGRNSHASLFTICFISTCVGISMAAYPISHYASGQPGGLQPKMFAEFASVLGMGVCIVGGAGGLFYFIFSDVFRDYNEPQGSRGAVYACFFGGSVIAYIIAFFALVLVFIHKENRAQAPSLAKASTAR